MGEYARRIFDDERIKIGTCEFNYYLRLEDKDQVKPETNSDFGYMWRLPFPDEDNVLPGNYEDPHRGAVLTEKFTLEAPPGTLQLKHECGLLLKVNCYHGNRLPNIGEEAKSFWNGKWSCWWELAHIRTPDSRPVVRCRACGMLLHTIKWDLVLPYIVNRNLAERLEFDYK